MSHPDYKHIGDPEDRVVEEIGEVLQELSKARRFGWFSSNPNNPGRTNIDRVREEVCGLLEALNSLDVKMREIEHAQFARREEVSSCGSGRKDGS